jgi:hypothetical protein
MNAHQFLIENHLGSEEGICAYGPRDAIRDGLRTAVATLGRPFTFCQLSPGGSYRALIGGGYREVGLSFYPPGSYDFEKGVDQLSDPPDATKDWCVYCSTDVRIFSDVPGEPHHELYEPALLLRDLTLAGLTCVIESGRAPGRADVASLPRERVVLIDAPADWAYAGEHIGAWADVVGPKLSVRHGSNLKSYNSICAPDFKIRDAEAKARDLEKILRLLQEIAAETSATAPSAP